MNTENQIKEKFKEEVTISIDSLLQIVSLLRNSENRINGMTDDDFRDACLNVMATTIDLDQAQVLAIHCMAASMCLAKFKDFLSDVIKDGEEVK